MTEKGLPEWAIALAKADIGKAGNMISLRQQIECVKRELKLRRRLYPRWVQAGKIGEQQAERELAGMEAVLKTLEVLQGKKEPSLFE